MITEQDYEVLYYVTPQQYRGYVLDGHADPNAPLNYIKQSKLAEKLLACSKNDFVASIIQMFKKKYANIWSVKVKIVDFDYQTEMETSKRKDFKKIIFDFRKEVQNIFGKPTSFMHNLFIEFDNAVSDINTSIKKGLQGTNYTETTLNNKTTFTVNDSPILKIEVTPKSFQIFLNKDYFIDYDKY